MDRKDDQSNDRPRCLYRHMAIGTKPSRRIITRNQVQSNVGRMTKLLPWTRSFLLS